MSKGIETIKDRLQRKRELYIHQEEKMEQMKCTMQNTSEEIEQLEYVLSEMEHIADANRAPRVIPNARVEEVFAYLCRVFEFLQHRLKLHFKYKLACEVIFAKISKYRDNNMKNKCFRNRNDEFDIFSLFLCVHF
mgnify:CR=1 FL=1